jgi:hypothetical protein
VLPTAAFASFIYFLNDSGQVGWQSQPGLAHVTK